MAGLIDVRTILLCGLEPDIATELRHALRDAGERGCSPNECNDPREEDARGAEVIFCPASASTIRRVRRLHPSACVIAVSRLPETALWLDAIEAGADDYCAPPMETGQLAWIIESATLSHSQTIAV